jgi:uncharacterized protein
MRHYGKLLRAALTALLPVPIAVAAVAGPLEDATAAYSRGDYATALRLYRPLADQGNATAQDTLGSMYAHGEGVPLNGAEAVKWTRRAADQDMPIAQYNLGRMYADGRGVPKDYLLAHMWFNLAAARGLRIAVQARDITEEMMTPAQISEAQKLAREWEPKPER